MAERARQSVEQRGTSSGDAHRRPGFASREQPPRETLVAREYSRRDYYLRRLLAISDASCVALALVFALWAVGGAPGHSFGGSLVLGLVTLPGWVVLFNMYGLYQRDAKRVSHSTLDDVPSVFHGLLLGSLLMWCWFVVVAPHPPQ